MIPKLYYNSENCCGCKACANACPKDAISFCSDEYGFQYPTIDEEKCIGCNKCVKTCDFQRKDEFGHYPLEGYATRHKDSDVYNNSTSGGVFTALAEWVIQRGGIVYGCVFDDNFIPIHIGVDTLEGISAMRGSKYAQSDIAFVYRDIKARLLEGKYVLFSGTPCQVAGLNSFLGKNDAERLLTADLICHGVPSALTLKKYLEYLEKKFHSKVDSFKFRSKFYGWTRPIVEISFKNEKVYRRDVGRNIFYSNFDKSNFQRPSCFHCKYACNSRCGDITIGDFWGFQKANLKMSIKGGLSCCLLNTPKAIECFKSLNIDVEKVDPSLIIQGNYHLRKPSPKGRDWETVMNSIKRNGFDDHTIRLLFYKRICMVYLNRIVSKLKKIVLKK